MAQRRPFREHIQRVHGLPQGVRGNGKLTLQHLDPGVRRRQEDREMLLAWAHGRTALGRASHESRRPTSYRAMSGNPMSVTFTTSDDGVMSEPRANAAMGT